MACGGKKQRLAFDVWEYPFPCKQCGRIDNNDKKFPITYLDANTKLCEWCFEELNEKENEE